MELASKLTLSFHFVKRDEDFSCTFLQEEKQMKDNIKKKFYLLEKSQQPPEAKTF